METIVWLITRLRHPGRMIGYKARVVNSVLKKNTRIFRQARIVDSYISYDSHVGCEANVRNTYVGVRTGIAERAIVGVYNRKNQRTWIGNDVMIGAGSIIIEGVRIGHGAWIGAGTVVRKNIPPYTVVAGNPTQTIRTRPTDEQGQKMG